MRHGGIQTNHPGKRRQALSMRRGLHAASKTVAGAGGMRRSAVKYGPENRTTVHSAVHSTQRIIPHYSRRHGGTQKYVPQKP